MFRKLLICFLLIGLCTGCSRRGPRPESLTGQGLKIGKVDVIIDEAAIGEYRANVLDKVDGETSLEKELNVRLQARQLLDSSSPITLRVNVTSFRLRHGALRAFTGFYSGTDHISGTMAVTEGATNLLSKPVEVSGGNGNPFNIGRDSRAEALIGALATLITNNLSREPLQARPQMQPASGSQRRP
jgi:hypothetical protein